jgi:ParB-like chromosome segregation protein Spo0J
VADRWQLLPALADEEYAALKADIASQGVLVPVVVDAETREVIEGHHRLRAWTELRAEGVKVPDYPKQVQRFESDDDRLAFVVAANLFRRHLTRQQRAEVVARLRAEGWSLRRIGDVIGVDDKTVRNDLAEIAEKSAIDLPQRVERKGGGTYPARRPRPTIFSQTDRDAERAARALMALDDSASGLIGLSRAEERARMASLDRMRADAAKGPALHIGESWELRTGDFREVLADLGDGTVDAVVTDPPYNNDGVPPLRAARSPRRPSAQGGTAGSPVGCVETPWSWPRRCRCMTKRPAMANPALLMSKVAMKPQNPPSDCNSEEHHSEDLDGADEGTPRRSTAR